MNLWFRLIAYLATMWRRGPLVPPHGVSDLGFRVWPSDLDIFGHMNNGRYATIMDYGRLDIMLRMGLWKVIRNNRWLPVVSTLSMRFRREMRLWQRFRLTTRIVVWQDEEVLFEHRLVLVEGHHAGQTAAIAMSKAGIYDRSAKAFVPINRLMREIGTEARSPEVTPEFAAIFEAGEALRAIARQDPPAA